MRSETRDRREDPGDAVAARQDLELIRRARAGDPVARRKFALRLLVVGRLVRAINSRRGSRLGEAALQDVAQDATLRIWQKAETFEGYGTFERWIYRFCLLEFMNHARRKGRDAHSDAEHEPVARESVEDLEQSETGRALEEALVDLGPPGEKIIRLRIEDDLTFEEIGRRLDMPVATAKTRYYRGMTWLRRRLGPKLNEDDR